MSIALQQMSKGGKTFYFASLWLDRSIREDAAIAYSFCRMVDDIADNLPPGNERARRLDSLLSAITTHDDSLSEARDMLSLIEKFPQIREPVQTLIRACTADSAGIRIETAAQLLGYAHGVAGTVGLIMYPILGGQAPEGRRYASDLGVAMQCTNIARDVISDLAQDRIYLPSEWLASADLQAYLQGDSLVESRVVSAVRRLLTLSDEYYSLGLHGLSFLHPRCRFAIRVAATCYAAIGQRVIHNGHLVRQRAVVPLYAKVLLMLRTSQAHRRGLTRTLPESVS